MARLLMLVVACLALSVSLSGCAFFSNAFWRCATTEDLDACSAFNAYLEQTPADRDGDGVSNAGDRCPDEYGGITTSGCPDRDGDGYADREDRCPDVPGVASACPPPPADVTPPAAPTGLTATRSGSRVVLDWDDNIDIDLASYTVKRGSTRGGPHAVVNGYVSDSRWDDYPPGSGTVYYIVTATDWSGNESAPSAEVSVSLSSCTPPDCLGFAARARTYRATVTGRVVKAGVVSGAGAELRDRGIVFAGALAGSGPPGLRRGTWIARLDLSLSGGVATARGVAIARFGSRGKLCLRFSQTMRGDHLLSGRFTAIGGTGRARALAAATRFTGSPARGAWVLRATGEPGRRLPRKQPTTCRAL